MFQRIQKIEASPDLIAAKFDPVVAQFETVLENLHERNRAHDESIGELRSAVSAVATTSKMLHEAIDAGTRGLREKFDGLSRGLEGGVEAALKLSGTLGQVTAAVRSDLEASSQMVAQLNAWLDEQVEAGRDAAKAVRDAVSVEIQSNRAAMDEFKSGMLADVESMKRHREESAALLMESRNTVAELQKTLVSLARLMTENA